MLNRIRSMRKKKSATDLEVKVPEVPESVPKVPDVDEMKEAAADAVPDSAVPGNMKLLLFKMWLAEKFSCCLGTPEMSKVGAVDMDIADVVVPESPVALPVNNE